MQIYSKSLSLKLDIVARVLAATIGAYAVAWAYTTLLSGVLWRAGLERSNAVAWATLTSYLVFLAVALSSFAFRSVLATWLCLIALTTLLALTAVMVGSA